MNFIFLSLIAVICAAFPCLASMDGLQAYNLHKTNMVRIVQHITEGQIPPKDLGEFKIIQKRRTETTFPSFTVIPNKEGEIDNGWSVSLGINECEDYVGGVLQKKYNTIHIFHLETFCVLEYRWSD